MIARHQWVPAFLFLFSLVAIALGYFLVHPEMVGWCPTGLDINCLGQSWDVGVGHPLYWGIHWLPFLFFFLTFIPKEIFISWAKFIWWIAVPGITLILISPPLAGNILTPDRTQMTEFITHLFVIVSVLWIGWKYWRLRETPSKT